MSVPIQDLDFHWHMSWSFSCSMIWCEWWLFVLLILVELMTITVCFVDIGGIDDHYCLFCWYWWNCWPSRFKLSFVLLILVELWTITVLNCVLFCWYWWNWWPSLFKTFFCFVDIGGIVDHQCLNFLCFVDIGRIVDHHCFNFLLFCWYWWNCWPSLIKLSLFCWYW